MYKFLRSLSLYNILLLLLFFSALFFNSTNLSAVKMYNILSTNAENWKSNPAFNKQIKNIMLFHPGGWAGLPLEEDWGVKDPTWPLHWGRSGYLIKDHNVYLKQFQEMKDMSLNMAVGMLLMTDAECNASGYGAYWYNQWVASKELWQHAKWAAWQKGLMICPHISICNYDAPGNPNAVLPKIKELVDFVMSTVDVVTLKTSDGKVVLWVHGYIPELTTWHKNVIHNYMSSKPHIFWIDGVTGICPTRAANIYNAGAVFDRSGTIQEHYKSIGHGRYLWSYLDRKGYFENVMYQAQYKIPFDVQLRWLNIEPHDSSMYPVLIWQWNEYAEFHIFEPTELDGYNGYDYLKWLLGWQDSLD